jgi:hypothetical protein
MNDEETSDSRQDAATKQQHAQHCNNSALYFMFAFPHCHALAWETAAEIIFLPAAFAFCPLHCPLTSSTTPDETTWQSRH